MASCLSGDTDGEVSALPERREQTARSRGPAYLMMTPLCMKMLMKCEPVQPLDSQ